MLDNRIICDYNVGKFRSARFIPLRKQWPNEFLPPF